VLEIFLELMNIFKFLISWWIGLYLRKVGRGAGRVGF
jgi:hypothetical protein